MSRQTEKLLVIDTETCNTLEQPIPYDIGYAVCDRKGNIYVKRSFVVAEVFLDMSDVMKSAYYAEKIPTYWEDIKSGKRIVKTANAIRKQIKEDMEKYKIKRVGAYNMGFDKRALNNLIRYTTKSFCRWFFPFGTKYFCIWSMACQTLLNTTSYIKFAERNNLVSDADNILTNAESCYKFITDSIDFAESHTGLEDVEIEIEIMAKCYRTHKKINPSINACCWLIPQKKRQENEIRKAYQKYGRVMRTEK